MQTVEYIIARDGCTERYSRNWLRHNEVIRRSFLRPAGNAPFCTALFPGYGSEIRRSDVPAWFHFQCAAEMTLELLLEGIMRYTQDGIAEIVHPGELYIIHKGSDTLFEQKSGDRMHRLRLMLRGSLVTAFRDSLRLTGKRVIPLTDPERSAALFRQIIDLMNAPRNDSGAEIMALTCRLLSEIAAESYRNGDRPPLLEQILQAMEKDRNHRLTIADFARQNGCGVHTLMRLFHRHLGTTPAAYREQLRYERACQLLRTTMRSLKEISEELGYCDQLYFSAAFRKHAGVSPTEYRKTHLLRD